MAGSASEIAWAAGLFEGEGCFYFGHRNLQATLAMTDADVVDRFERIVGFGHRSVREGDHKNDKRGYKNEWKPIYRWSARSFEHVQALIAMLWPYLGDRRKARAKELLLDKRIDRLMLYRNRGRNLADCAVDGCARTVEARGWCKMHLRRFYRTGSPLMFLRDLRKET